MLMIPNLGNSSVRTVKKKKNPYAKIKMFVNRVRKLFFLYKNPKCHPKLR